MNGNIIGEKGEFIFIGGTECTVIDYIIGDEKTKRKIKRLKIGNKVDSDHHPLEVWVQEMIQKKKKSEKNQEIERMVWNREKLFREKLKIKRKERKDVEEEWGEMERKIKKALKEIGVEQKKK